MSKPWNPEEELARIRDGGGKASRWPAGATAGLVLVSAACIGAGMLLYKLAGPRDIFTP